MSYFKRILYLEMVWYLIKDDYDKVFFGLKDIVVFELGFVIVF